MDFGNSDLQIEKWKARYIMQQFKCQRCGLCCIYHTHIGFSPEDWRQLKRKSRKDIIHHPLVNSDLSKILRELKQKYGDEIKYIDDSGLTEVPILSPAGAGYSTRKDFLKELKRLKEKTEISFLWGGTMNHCPFLKRLRDGKYKCLIHDVKPNACKKFPAVWHGLNTEYVACPALKKLGVNCKPVHPNFPEKIRIEGGKRGQLPRLEGWGLSW